MLVLRGEFGLAKKPRSVFDNSPALPESLPNFNGCPSVNHKSIDGVVYSKDGKKLIKFSPVRRCYDFKIPEGVEEIDANAFDWNKHIRRIQLPETLKNLKAGTFATCEKLSTIYIPSTMEYIEDGCFADYFYTFGLVRIKDRKLPKNLIKAITPKFPKRHKSGWLPASQQSKDYVVVHLIDKDSDPLEKISNCPAIERLYLPKMNEGWIDEINEYYNTHPFDSKYTEETWKYCSCNHLLSLRLAVKVFFFINDKHKDVNACIRENGFAICHFLMKDIKEELNEYIDKYHLGERFIEVELKRINRRKEILLSIVNSGLLQAKIEVKQNKRITWNFQSEKIVIEPNIPTLISHAGLTQNSKYTSSLYNSSHLVMTSISSPNRSALRFRSLHFVLDTNQNSELSINSKNSST